MATLKIVLSVLFIIVSIVITIVILFQEGKSAGLGTIAGVADTYWGKNKGRSKEGRLVKATIVCVVLFFIISIALNMGIWSILRLSRNRQSFLSHQHPDDEIRGFRCRLM